MLVLNPIHSDVLWHVAPYSFVVLQLCHYAGVAEDEARHRCDHCFVKHVLLCECLWLVRNDTSPCTVDRTDHDKDVLCQSMSLSEVG